MDTNHFAFCPSFALCPPFLTVHLIYGQSRDFQSFRSLPQVVPIHSVFTTPELTKLTWNSIKTCIRLWGAKGWELSGFFFFFFFFPFSFSALAVGSAVPMFPWRQWSCSQKDTPSPSCLLPLLAAALLGADLVAPHCTARLLRKTGDCATPFTVS